MKEIITEWNPWWMQTPKFNLIDRKLKKEIINWINRKEIISILGVRRCGKTSLIYLTIEHLLKSTNPKNILFIKCDDDRVKKENLIDSSIESYKELVNPKGKMFIFIDEIQEISEWEATLKRIYDLKKDIKFFITGSNFSMLKEDMTYKLAGRLAYFELYPFSLKEFLRFDNNNKISITSKKQEIKHYLFQYMEFGGFPEVTLEKDKKKKILLLQYYFDTIIYRDVIKKRSIRNSAKMEKMINYLLQNISNPANFSKIGKLVSLSTDSIGEYIKYLQDAFLIFNISLFDFSVKKQEINPKKIYCVDTGKRNIKGFRFSKDSGRLYENIVFIEIKRKNCANPLIEIYYWKDNQQNEVDFIIKQGQKVKQLIQVCYNLNDEKIKQREIRALIKASKELKCNNLIIITEDKEAQEIINNKKIKFIPLWKWLLI